MICDGFCDRVKWLLEYRTFATPLLSSPGCVAFAFLFRVTTVITSEIFLRETSILTPLKELMTHLSLMYKYARRPEAVAKYVRETKNDNIE